MSSQLTQLTQLVQSSATQEELNTILTPAQTLAGTVDGVEGDLAYFANACPPVPAGSTPTNPSSYCTSEKTTVMGELNSVTILQGYGTMQGYIADNPTILFRGILHLSSLYLAQSKPFFRPADSTDMQNLFDYWDAALTQAANLNVEQLHAVDAQDSAPTQLTDFMGNPTLNPPTTGTFQANEAANLKLMYPAVPVGTVINTRDHKMWATDYPVPSWDSCNTYWGMPPPLGSTFNGPFTSSLTWNGITGWISPSFPDFQALIQGWTGQNPNSWLTAQTEAVSPDSPPDSGFANLVTPPLGCLGGGLAWTSTPNGSYYSDAGKQYPEYYLVNFSDGAGGPGTPNSGGEAAGLNNWYFIVLDRSLGQGEQYFWYN